MANLNPGYTWHASIPSFLTTDPVQGADPDGDPNEGVDNIPHLKLTERTNWLKIHHCKPNLRFGLLGQFTRLASSAIAFSFANHYEEISSLGYHPLRSIYLGRTIKFPDTSNNMYARFRSSYFGSVSANNKVGIMGVVSTTGATPSFSTPFDYSLTGASIVTGYNTHTFDISALDSGDQVDWYLYCQIDKAGATNDAVAIGEASINRDLVGLLD